MARIGLKRARKRQKVNYCIRKGKKGDQMKFISIPNLVKILEAIHTEAISEATIQNIIDWYSDDFQPDEAGSWQKIRENSDIRTVLGSKYERLPQKINTHAEN